MTEVADFLVIIPTFRRPQTLEAAILSAQNQVGVTKQIVVVDDSPEGSAEEIARSFPGVIYLKNPQPSGGWPGRVRNYGFEATRKMEIAAKYIHFLDDDDAVAEGYYASVKETFTKYRRIGVVFGILRPTCRYSDDPDIRKLQEQHLQNLGDWRIMVARQPWLYDSVATMVKIPAVRRWLFSLHAMFGPEMFLCSGGVVRHEHFIALGGFPDIRITEDFAFFTKAIRRFGVRFLKREAVAYGVGEAESLWTPLDLRGRAKMAHIKEFLETLRARQQQLQAELGESRYNLLKRIFSAEQSLLERWAIPALERRGYFNDLYHMTAPDRFAKGAGPGAFQPIISRPTPF